MLEVHVGVVVWGISDVCVGRRCWYVCIELKSVVVSRLFPQWGFVWGYRRPRRFAGRGVEPLWVGLEKVVFVGSFVRFHQDLVQEELGFLLLVCVVAVCALVSEVVGGSVDRVDH